MTQTPADQPRSDAPGAAPAAPASPSAGGEEHVVVVGPDGQPVGAVPVSALQGMGIDTSRDLEEEDERNLTDLVEQPAKVMRIGSMVKQLLEEVKAAPLDEASRARLADIHAASVKELEQGLAPELVEELDRLSLPFAEGTTPSDAELRIAQAQLVGWLEGLFHGIQTAIYAQQMAARAQVEQARRALPAGPGRPGPGTPGPAQPQPPSEGGAGSGGMYL